jgi:hypothetical protein
MTKQYFVSAVIAVLLLGAPANAQSAADLLQKGIHAQETVGDVDGAIQIFRQVAASPAANKVLAAPPVRNSICSRAISPTRRTW